MENKVVIEKLENTRNLLIELNSKVNFLEQESEMLFAQKSFEIQRNLGTLQAPDVFSNFPVFPIDASYIAATKKDKESKEKIFKPLLIASCVLVALYFITHWNFLNTISVLCIFATIVFGFFYNTSKKQYNKKKEVYDKSVEKYNKTNKDFLVALEVFEEQKEACLIAAKEYSQKYSEACDDVLSAFVDKVSDESEAEKRIEEIHEELANNGVITSDYYHLIDDIISNLKNGRADYYKEALNIAIREEKEEFERQQRLAQEQRRNEILAMQAEEERRHNEQMERQQREHEQAMLREQKRQNDAIIREQRDQAYEAKRQADKAASEARKQADAQRSAGISKCASCANSSRCPSHIKNNGSGLTCGGYVPYGTK